MKHQKLSIERKQLSDEDIDLLTYELLPKYKRNFVYISLIFVFSIPILPFFPAKHTHKTLVQSMSYEMAVCVSTFLVLLAIAGIYYFGVFLINKDFKGGFKSIYRTRVSRKVRKSNTKFILEINERPKSIISKIELNKDDFDEWQKHDIIEINYLERSGEILSYKKIIE